jgi:hypothetical protein
MIDLESIHKMWEADSRIKENELDIASLDVCKMHAKYLELFNTARLALKKRELELSELKQDKWRYFAGKMTKEEIDEKQWDYDPFKGSTKPMKSELSNYIDSDKDIQKTQLKIEYSKIVVEALEEIISTLRWRHQTIRNILDFRKFQAGM